MRRPTQITFRGMDPSEAVRERVLDRAAEIELLDERITGVHVTVEAPHRHHHQGNLFSVRIDIHLPDSEIVVGREHHDQQGHEDVYVALRDAFDAARRQLEEHLRRRSGKGRAHAGRARGRVARSHEGETPDTEVGAQGSTRSSND